MSFLLRVGNGTFSLCLLESGKTKIKVFLTIYALKLEKRAILFKRHSESKTKNLMPFALTTESFPSLKLMLFRNHKGISDHRAFCVGLIHLLQRFD